MQGAGGGQWMAMATVDSRWNGDWGSAGLVAGKEVGAAGSVARC